jgi:hypothetical protein
VRNVYKVGKPEGRRALGRLNHRLKVNIKMDHKEIGWKDVDWIHLVQGRDEW